MPVLEEARVRARGAPEARPERAGYGIGGVSALLGDQADRVLLFEGETLYAEIASEHKRTLDAVLQTLECRTLLERQPVLRRSIQLRNPYVVR